MELNGPDNKLLLLYLINKIDSPLSRSQITDFIIQSDYMDYYTLQQTLAEMVEGSYLESTTDYNTTRYTLTDEGLTTLEYFEKHIPQHVRTKINNYIKENRSDIKRSFDNATEVFPNSDNTEFKVVCGVYDEGNILLELSIMVDTREQVRLLQKNWKANAKTMYGEIIALLARDAGETDKNEDDKN